MARALAARLRGWLPRGMAGQLLALLLGGMVATHLAGLAVLSRDQGDIHPLARRQALDLFAQLAHAVHALPPSVAADTVLAAFDGPQSHFRTLSASPAPQAGEEGFDSEIAAELHRQLGPAFTAVAARVDGTAQPPAAHPQERGVRTRLLLWARLPDGRWLRGEQWPWVRTRWWWPVSFWLQLGLVPVVLAAGWAARQLVRPGRALVDAAGRVSRGEYVAPLAVEGPQEMRDILQAFNEMQQRLHRFVEDRTRMLAAIGHDLRTPITSLRLRAELVDDAALRAAMVRTLDGMTAMVDETLRFARDDAAREPTQAVDLRQLLDDLVQEHAALGHDVRWAGTPPLAVLPYRCRPAALRRALANLVDNAVRYGERARVRLVTPGTQGSVHIEIEDDGPGIPEPLVETAFAPFTRLADTVHQQRDARQDTGCVGLGLAIARSCARAHGGDIVLSRSDSQGLRACLVLP